jgi:hypothetical protein
VRNHNEKHRDISRSVLPSIGRREARARRRQIHHRERARVRVLLGEIRRAVDVDEQDVEPSATFRADLSWMVAERRGADKLGPLLHWAARTIERDPVLAEASTEDLKVHFRALLPVGLIGTHALVHLDWVFEGHHLPAPRVDPGGDPAVRRVADIECP